MNTNKVAVLGGGSFGTVLANIAASNGSDVSLWVRDSEQALRINSEGANTDYHPELQLSSNIEASEKLDEVVNNASIVLIATPSLIFEINMKHKLSKKLKDLKGKQFSSFVDFLYDYAVIAEGGSPQDPSKYLRQLDKYLS